MNSLNHTSTSQIWGAITSVREREEFIYALLASLPRSSIAAVQRRITPLLQVDILGLLPDEVALLVLSYLPAESLLICSLVCQRWHALADDQSLWKRLCRDRNWRWRIPHRDIDTSGETTVDVTEDCDDEGMGDEEDSDSEGIVRDMLIDDSGYVSMMVDPPSPVSSIFPPSPSYTGAASSLAAFHTPAVSPASRARVLHSPYPSPRTLSRITPDYKLLHQTHVRLRNRMRCGSYSLTNLQMRNSTDAHTNAIYCLQLYTYPDTGVQVLFTGSKDRSIREWSLETGEVTRVIEGIHESSVLTISVHNGLLASGGSDRLVAVWDLKSNSLVKLIQDHGDSVLCVRFDDKRLVSCSKDRTVRTYALPSLKPVHVLRDHRAAVNAVAISGGHIVSASGDRSIRLWDAETGAMLRTFENHHGRGIAAIDFKPPFVISGSSDKHLRMLDISTAEGWSTASESVRATQRSALTRSGICETCGNRIDTNSVDNWQRQSGWPHAHNDLVRSVALNADLVVSGSYDFTVKVWERQSGALIADLAGGHTGRIFCVGFDSTKIVSCGEDQRICIWDFSHGIDTSFIAT